MRPNDTVFSRSTPLAEAYAALSRQLKDGGAQAPAQLLPVVAVLQEVEIVARAVLEGRRVFDADRASLKIDVARSVSGLGDELARLLRPLTDEFQQDVARLPQLLEDAAGAQVALAAAEAVLLRLAESDARAAAWADCVTAFEGDAPAGECELRIAQLKGQLEFAGHDWDERVRRLTGVLNDFHHELELAGADVGDEPERLNDSAGVSIDIRLELCRQLVSATPPTGSVVVWMAFANAKLPGFYVRRADVEFYDGGLWDAIRTEWPGAPHDWTRPPELADQFVEMFFRGVPAKDFVLVRVPLVEVTIASARGRARDLVTGMAELTISGRDGA